MERSQIVIIFCNATSVNDGLIWIMCSKQKQ